MRLLALDVGDERIGVAISDETGAFARPYAVIPRVRGAASYLRIREIVEQEGVARIIVGLPLLEDGRRGKQVASVEAYVRGLEQHVELPITYWYERYTTLEAQELWRETGARQRDRQEIDAVAAAVILRDYIEHQSGGTR